MVEVEGKGVDYERYALNKLFKKITEKYGLESVLEIPAKGEKAMPSLYSLGFKDAGCNITLVNAEEKSKSAWKTLNYNVNYLHADDLSRTAIADESFDLVWNFMYIAHHVDKAKFLNEMMRLSKRYVFYIAVNRFNIGFYSHRTVHRITKIPWTHGDVKFMNPYYVKRFFQSQGLKVLETNVVDTPPWPDSLGIRDMKLHKKNVDLNKIDWHSRTIDWMKQGKYPLKIKLYYLIECIPLPFVLKLPYAHLFYVLAEKV